MSDKSKIEWTDATWPIVTGCTKISDGCKHCYAECGWPRLSANPNPNPNTIYHGREFTDVACHPGRLDWPLRWRRPRMIFVPSMGDLFHPDVPDSFIDQVLRIIAGADRHTFQVLTKRPRRMAEYMTRWRSHHALPVNLWLGTSIEDQNTADERIPQLLRILAAVLFVSAEPLLGSVDLSRWVFDRERAIRARTKAPVMESREQVDAIVGRPLDWVIAGGESGPKPDQRTPIGSIASVTSVSLKMSRFFSSNGENGCRGVLNDWQMERLRRESIPAVRSGQRTFD